MIRLAVLSVGCAAALTTDPSDFPGKHYRGDNSMTKSGFCCQNWASQTPHSHSNMPHQKKYDYGIGRLVMSQWVGNNFCRNPDKEPNGVWCYTTSPGKRWEYCDQNPNSEDLRRADRKCNEDSTIAIIKVDVDHRQTMWSEAYEMSSEMRRTKTFRKSLEETKKSYSVKVGVGVTLATVGGSGELGFSRATSNMQALTNSKEDETSTKSERKTKYSPGTIQIWRHVITTMVVAGQKATQETHSLVDARMYRETQAQLKQRSIDWVNERIVPDYPMAKKVTSPKFVASWVLTSNKPKPNIAPLDSKWINGYFGDYAACPTGYIATGMCGSGRFRDCSGYAHQLQCSRFDTIDVVLLVGKYTAAKKWYGEYSKCNDPGENNYITSGRCGSGSNADCDGYYHGLECKKIIRAVISTDCQSINADYGEQAACTKGYVLTESCGSGGNADCDGAYTRGTCCRLVPEHD